MNFITIIAFFLSITVAVVISGPAGNNIRIFTMDNAPDLNEDISADKKKALRTNEVRGPATNVKVIPAGAEDSHSSVEGWKNDYKDDESEDEDENLPFIPKPARSGEPAPPPNEQQLRAYNIYHKFFAKKD